MWHKVWNMDWKSVNENKKKNTFYIKYTVEMAAKTTNLSKIQCDVNK